MLSLLCLKRAALLLAVIVPAPAASAAEYRPYAPVPVHFDRGFENDAELKALIERLRASIGEQNLGVIAKELAPGLVIAECSADALKPCPPPPAPAKPNAAKTSTAKKSALPPRPFERLLAGLCCKDIPVQHITKKMREETALGIFGAALEDETLGENPDVPGSACLPAFPKFDRELATKITDAADIEPGNLRVAAQALSLREKPSATAPPAGEIAAGQLVPLVTDLPESLPDGWSAVALPQGRLGYTRDGGLNDLAPAGICFARDESGAWKIALVALRR